ncbi:hypothetical protein V8G54_022408 [Vigna mungo]|uniref:Uncharacterized protein n=1 Tax=Vigna mungo TaxID=3915 RepID=A0AAQ3RWP5_VIGMU
MARFLLWNRRTKFFHLELATCFDHSLIFLHHCTFSLTIFFCDDVVLELSPKQEKLKQQPLSKNAISCMSSSTNLFLFDDGVIFAGERREVIGNVCDIKTLSPFLFRVFHSAR